MLIRFLIRNGCFSGLAFFAIVLCGCESMHYYSQAVQGQYQILEKRQPISGILADSESPEFLRQRLAFILEVRQFAKNDLQLPVKNHYLTYVDLKRPYVVWNVFAAPEFSLVPKTWCYPFVGCAAYRGYFSPKNADQYAAKLKRQGYDVYVAGVSAYSTLGWFDDPVLSSFLHYSEMQSAALIFHELAHQVLYVKGDTAFNESFATTVEQEGLQRWLAATPSADDYGDYLRQYNCEQQFIHLILKYRQRLETVYQSDDSATVKREKKAAVIAELRAEFNRLKSLENGLAAYDNWINSSLNNAKFVSVSAYHAFVPAFKKMLQQSQGNLSQFYGACRELGQAPKNKRHQVLNTYLDNLTTRSNTQNIPIKYQSTNRIPPP